MKLLLDENLPVKLKYRFNDAGFNAFTVGEMNWFGIANGKLLELLLSNNFYTFITIDNNLQFQQNFISYPLKVIVVVAPDNTYETIMEIFPKVIESLDKVLIGVHSIVHPFLQNVK